MDWRYKSREEYQVVTDIDRFVVIEKFMICQKNGLNYRGGLNLMNSSGSVTCKLKKTKNVFHIGESTCLIYGLVIFIHFHTGKK